MNKRGGIITCLAIIASIVGVILWQYFFSSINYYVACACVLIASMLPFFASFELKKITSREIALVATLIALAVMSRAAFYLIPQVKPIAAVVIVSAACLGAERGYIIGAFSAFVSNFIFGQGYWTPFQMVALGAVGLIAGIVFKYVKANRWTMAALGFALASALYGVIVDLSTILMMYGSNLSWQAVLSVYAAGVPFSLVFGASTAVFLLLFGEAFVKKIDRVNTKFALVNGDRQ